MMPNQQTVGRHRDTIILNTGKRTFMFFGRSFVVNILHLSSHYLWYCVKIYHWIRMFYSISQLIKNESCNYLEILAVLAISVCNTMPKVCLCISPRPTVANSCTNQCEWHRMRIEAIFSFKKIGFRTESTSMANQNDLIRWLFANQCESDTN